MGFLKNPLATVALSTALCALAPTAWAGVWPSDWSVCPGIEQAPEDNDIGQPYEIFVSPHTHHWTYSEEHKQVIALSVSRILPNERFCGFSLFTNSFGQPSAYAFTGWYWPNPIASMPNVYATVSGGIVYGYVGRFKNKVPLNVGGFSPVIIPAVGYRLTPRVAVEMQVLGTAALMFGVTWRY
jgi:hypothetical protein